MTINAVATYRYSLSANGVAAAHNFLTLTAQASDGIIMSITDVHVRSNAVGVVSDQPPLTMYRCSAVSGGSVVNNTTGVTRYRTGYPISSTTLRTGNPAATLGTPVYRVRSVESVGSGTGPGVEFLNHPPHFVLLPGESVVFRTETGDVDQRWIIGIEWQEDSF